MKLTPTRDGLLALLLGVAAARPSFQLAAAESAVQGRRLAAVLAEAGGEMRNPGVRRRVVEELKQGEAARAAEARERARRLGWPLRGAKPGGGAWELAEFDGDLPLYRITLNANAAITTGSDLLWLSPYHADGAGGTVGVWDASSALTTHQEFGGRVRSVDGAGVTYDHSTHVVGTVCAAGVDPAAKGMSPAVRVDSYDWNSDESEMTSRGASYPGEPGMIYLSNHSYGYNAGWVYTGSHAYTWYGSGSTAAGSEDDFGTYNFYARDLDALAYSMPYYLVCWAAGNDRIDNPVNGDSVVLPPSVAGVAYDSALHPPGDGTYRNGYDTISFNALSKNVLTVGAVTDAVSGGARSVGSAVMTSFSSWGPTDDGRIKPDAVANGYQLKSASYAGAAAYSTMSGTSMATPSAAGSAQQLLHGFNVLFANHALRASTLKALLLHTADDMGNAGPDYVYGWGLLNAKGAADLLMAYRTNAGTQRVVEDRVATNRPAVSVAFMWDGASPIRATLCWTDPAGASTTAGDSRVARLVNNLDLRVIGPDAAVYQPWVMPFVGDWSPASCAYPATTGSNSTDNVEQVLINAPSAAGVYTVRVTYAGTLASGSQPFSLLMSGMRADQRAPGPSLVSSAPARGTGVLPVTMKGDHFLMGAEAFLRRQGQPDVRGSNVEVLGDTAEARFDTAGMAGGWWRMILVNPDGQRAVLQNAFAVPGPLWAEDFETNDIAAKGWSQLSEVGSSLWSLSAAASVSPAQSMHSPGAAARSDTSLVSPGQAIPSGAFDLRLTFWHAFDLEAGDDGGVLEFSLDGGAWFDVAAAGSGASFVSNGYNATLSSTGAPDSRNPLAGRFAWSGASGGFVPVVVALADAAKYAGHTLRVRWRLGTNSKVASAGWFVDDAELSGIGPPPPVPPAGTQLLID